MHGHRGRAGHRAAATLPDLFAHSVVPIIVGYIVAHYLSYFVEVGQQTLIQASDPLSNGSNLLRHRRLRVQLLALLPPDVPGRHQGARGRDRHVVGVIAAHDRAIKLLPKKHQLTGQLPLLVVMVVFTVGGLYLLFARLSPAPAAARRAATAPGASGVDQRRPTARPQRGVADLGQACGRPPGPGRRSARSSGRKCTPGQPGEALDHAGDVALGPAEASAASG